MNNFERQVEIDTLVDTHTARELAAMIIDLRNEVYVLEIDLEEARNYDGY